MLMCLIVVGLMLVMQLACAKSVVEGDELFLLAFDSIPFKVRTLDVATYGADTLSAFVMHTSSEIHIFVTAGFGRWRTHFERASGTCLFMRLGWIL